MDEPDRDSDPGAATRWVVVFGALALLLVLIVITLHLTGRGLGGHHG